MAQIVGRSIGRRGLGSELVLGCFFGLGLELALCEKFSGEFWYIKGKKMKKGAKTQVSGRTKSIEWQSQKSGLHDVRAKLI